MSSPTIRQAGKIEEEIRNRALVDEVAKVITSTLEIHHVYVEFAQQLQQLVDFDRAVIVIVNQDAGTMEYKYCFGEPVPGHGEGQLAPLEDTRTQKLLMTGQTFVTEDVSSQHQYDAGHDP